MGGWVGRPKMAVPMEASASPYLHEEAERRGPEKHDSSIRAADATTACVLMQNPIRFRSKQLSALKKEFFH